MQSREVKKILTKTFSLLQRRSAMLSCADLHLKERLKLACARHPDPSALLAPRVKVLDTGVLQLQFAGFCFEVLLEVSEASVEARVNHFCQVLAETFIDPLFFYGPVGLAPGQIALDLGGNIGSTAALFSRMVGPNGKVFAFEPSVPDILSHTLTINRIENVELVRAAVSDHCGSAEMSMGFSGMDSTLVRTLDWHTEKKMVTLVSLDQFIVERDIPRVHFIKMDIEGAEESAILGAKNLIARDRPQWSISSYHIDFCGEKQHSKLVKLLRSSGYTVSEISNFHIYAY